MMAFVFGVMTFSMLSADISKVSGSLSAKTGTAPQSTTGIEVEDMVNAGTITSSPGCTPTASSATWSVAVPLQWPMAYFAWKHSANSRSSRVL